MSEYALGEFKIMSFTVKPVGKGAPAGVTVPIMQSGTF